MVYRFIKHYFPHLLLVSTFVGLLFLGYAAKAMTDFYAYKKAVGSTADLNIKRFNFFLKNTLKGELVRLSASSASEQSPLKTFFISADIKDINKLNSNLPRSGKEQYIDAFLRIGGSRQVKKVKLRYRGDNTYHWLYPKKSLRIKLKKSDVYNMERKFNLLNPPHIYSLVDCVNYDLSRELGLITPDYFPVRAFINGKYMGVHMYLSHPDESLLRKHKRMPGSLYSGDVAPVGQDGVSLLWRDEKFWKKMGARNAEQKKIREDMQLLINAVNNFDQIDFYEFATAFIDLKKFYLYTGLDVLVGSGHHTYLHNHRLYFDPYIGKFEPISWDIRYWTSYTRGKDLISYPLLKKVILNPLLESQRDQVAYGLLKKYSAPDIFHRLKAYADLVYNDLESDPYKDHGSFDERRHLFPGVPDAISKPFFMKEFNQSIKRHGEIIRKRHKYLYKIYNDSAVFYKADQIETGLMELTFMVDGNSGALIDLRDIVLGNDVRIFRDINFNGTIDDKDISASSQEAEALYPGRKLVKGRLNPKASPATHGNYYLTEGPLYYRYLIAGDAKIKKTGVEATNIITGENEPVVYTQFDAEKTSDSIHPWKLPADTKKDVILSGTIYVKKQRFMTRPPVL